MDEGRGAGVPWILGGKAARKYQARKLRWVLGAHADLLDAFIHRCLLSARLVQGWGGEFPCSPRWPGRQGLAEGVGEPGEGRATQPAPRGPGGEWAGPGRSSRSSKDPRKLRRFKHISEIQ